MSPYEYLKDRQICWASRHGKRLGGQFRHDPDPAQAERGEELFAFDLDENLFEPLSPEVRSEYEAGDGGELEGPMDAVHSSSALVANAFHYWLARGFYAEIARALRIPSTGIVGMRFEAKHPIHDRFRTPPNLDVVFDYQPSSVCKAVAVESKFNEPYGGWEKQRLKAVYLDHPEFWPDLPNLHEIGRQVSPDNTRFAALDAPQLIKHTLGLKAAYGKRGFRLIYLHYDVPGSQGARHAEKVDEFARCLERDGVRFQSLTYQDVIWSLARNQGDRHREFVGYLTERYL